MTPDTVKKISATIEHQDAVEDAARMCTGVSSVGKSVVHANQDIAVFFTEKKHF
jgi:hypothetical protein